MSESRAWIFDQVNQGATGVELPGPGDGTDDQVGAESDDRAGDQQDEEQADPSVVLPDTWPRDFVAALTDEARRDLENGMDMSLEYGAWSRGEVDTGQPEPESLPTFEIETPMSGDECLEQADLWGAIAAGGGDEETSAEDAIAYADAWRLQARATMVQEARLGRRQAYTLEPRDARAVIQAEMDARVQAARERYGRQPGDR